MSTVKQIKVKFVKKWKVDEQENKTPVYNYKSVSSSSYRRYYNTLCVLAGIEKSSRDVLDYICERMDNNNIIHSNAKMRAQFISDIKKWTDGSLIYSDSTVKKAFHTLVKKNLLVKTDTRGTLIVNPEYFFKGDEARRISSIQMILEFDNQNNPDD